MLWEFDLSGFTNLTCNLCESSVHRRLLSFLPIIFFVNVGFSMVCAVPEFLKKRQLRKLKIFT